MDKVCRFRDFDLGCTGRGQQGSEKKFSFLMRLHCWAADNSRCVSQQSITGVMRLKSDTYWPTEVLPLTGGQVVRIWLLFEVRRVMRDRDSSVVASAVLSKVVFKRPLIQPFAGIGGWIRDN